MISSQVAFHYTTFLYRNKHWIFSLSTNAQSSREKKAKKNDGFNDIFVTVFHKLAFVLLVMGSLLNHLVHIAIWSFTLSIAECLNEEGMDYFEKKLLEYVSVIAI